MSTIASLLALADPQIKPWSEGVQSATQAQTGLRNLADLKAKQQAEALVIEQIKNDPEVRQRLFGDGGGPVLGSLMQPQAPPGAGPMTQQTVMPGQAPGAPQTVPGGMDLSRFATQGGPPQSTLGSLGPAGQPQMPAPQNPLLEMARTDPRAAMMLQQQIQGQQDAAMKRQEQRLKMGSAMMDSLGQMAQGVTDQAGWDQMRQDAAQIDPQLAARLEPVYSKEAKERLIAQAVGVKDSLTLQVQTMAAQAELAKARMSGRVAKTDQYLKALGVAPGAETAQDMEKALAWQQRDEIMVSQMHGAGQLKDTSLGVTRIRPGGSDVEVIKGPDGQPLQPKPSEAEQKSATLANSVAAANKRATELEDKGYEPKAWEKGADMLPLGLGNLVTSSEHQQYRQTVSEFASAWLYGVSGAQINDDEWERANQTFFRQPNEDKAAVALKRQRRADLVKQLEQQTAATGRTGTQPPPTSQGSTGTGGQASTTSGAFKPLKDMSREERLAERDALRKKAGL